MTVKFKGYIIIPSFSIWLALSNQIAFAKKTNPLLEEKNESYSGFKNSDKKHVLIKHNAFREKLKEKFINYVSDTHSSLEEEKKSSDKLLDVSQKNIRKGELIADAINDLSTDKELNNQSSKLSEEQSLRALPLVNRLAQQSNIKPLEKLSPVEIKPLKASNSSSEYISPPKIAAPENIHPFTTTLPLNGIPISHLTEWELYTGATFGDDNNTSISAGGIVKLDGQITESLTKDNIYTVDQEGSYLQLQRIRETRKVELTRNETAYNAWYANANEFYCILFNW